MKKELPEVEIRLSGQPLILFYISEKKDNIALSLSSLPTNSLVLHQRFMCYTFIKIKYKKGEIALRKLEGFPRILAFIIGVSLTIITFYTAFNGLFLATIQRSIHLTMILAIVFLWFPASKKVSPKNKPSIIDYILSISSLLILFWTLTNNSRFMNRIVFVSEMSTIDIIAGIVLVALSIEAARRTMGWVLVTLSLIFIAYGFFGQYLPSLISHTGFSIQEFVDLMYLSQRGLFSSLMGLSATILFVFISFGTFLQATNTDKHYMDLSLAIAGDKPGGPAKVAVLSSAAMGSISGSTMSNVLTTGNLTIPLMKKTGYKAHEAGAIETVSSAAGQIIPPVMGTGAFLMAAIIGVEYLEIVKVSIVPALIFVLSIWFFVDFKARRNGIFGLDETPDVLDTLKKSWHLFLPLIILIVMLIYKFTPFLAGSVATLLIYVLSFVREDSRMGLKKFFLTLEKCAINTAMVTGIIACATIIVGVINQTGIMNRTTSIILSLANNNLVLTIIIICLISYLLGMGLPVVTAYILVATLGAPALIELGIPAIAAHLSIFWFSQLSTITPPVCMTAFAAAAIAKAPPMKTGFASLKIGMSFYIIPILFLFSTILTDGWITVILIGLVTIAAMYLFAASLEGYLFGKATIIMRIITFIAFILMLTSTFNSVLDFRNSILLFMVGLLLVAAMWIVQGQRKKKVQFAN